jgi:hypothetical protein
MQKPPSASLRARLDAAARRLRLQHALRAIAAGSVTAGAAIVFARILRLPDVAAFAIGASIFFVVASLWFASLRTARSSAAAAAAFERADSSLRNLVITAAEISETAGNTPSYMRHRVLAEADRRASTLDPARVVPLARDAVVVMAAVVVLGILALARPAAVKAAIIKSSSPRITKPPAYAFAIDVVPPLYTGRPTVRLTNPTSVEAIAGSQAIVRLPAGPSQIRLNGALVPASAQGIAEAVLTASGYLAIDAGSVHRLLPLSVTPDRAPEVRITAPAKDMRLASTAVSIPIAAEAIDDLALRSFELRYTVVSGSGEQFSFTEGSMPATMTRGSDRAWRIETRLSPAQLKLEPGDALIYRAVAADRRPGDAGLASSDTFFVEIAGPGDVALAGVEMPPDKERYALSEAMIVLKIERLQARERSMARPAIEEAAGNIAAEQRAVRANFIFLLGGEIQDEEVEAETSSEISEGRFANKARQEIVSATVLMGRVERALAAASTKEALPLAREAVRALQRAFGHSRYLLRALPARARIDPARRGSGDLASAAGWTRALAPPAADPETEVARTALMDLIAIARALDARAERAEIAGRLEHLAEKVLSAAAGAPALQPAARDVLAARDAVSASEVDKARAALERAAGPLVTRAQRGRIDGAVVGRHAARLAGAAAIAPGGGRQ